MKPKARRYKSAFVVFIIMWLWLFSQTLVACGTWGWNEVTTDHTDNPLIIENPRYDSDPR